MYEIAKRLIKEKKYVVFLVGKDSDFDLDDTSVIRLAVREFDYGNSILIRVLP